MLAKCGRLSSEQATEMQRLANKAAVGQFCVALRMLGWSHDAAAAALGVSRQQVWRWVNELCVIPSWAVVAARGEAEGHDSIRSIVRTA
jgi:hypothetical protein